MFDICLLSTFWLIFEPFCPSTPLASIFPIHESIFFYCVENNNHVMLLSNDCTTYVQFSTLVLRFSSMRMKWIWRTKKRKEIWPHFVCQKGKRDPRLIFLIIQSHICTLLCVYIQHAVHKKLCSNVMPKLQICNIHVAKPHNSCTITKSWYVFGKNDTQFFRICNNIYLASLQYLITVSPQLYYKTPIEFILYGREDFSSKKSTLDSFLPESGLEVDILQSLLWLCH